MADLDGADDGVEVVDAGPRRVSRSIEVAAPAAELFDLVADPHRHGELDGSGSVRSNVRGPARMSKGAQFTTQMKMYGFPYRITSRVTAFDENQVIEWRHPAGHRWRWEFTPLGPDRTRVTETFDYHRGGAFGYRVLGFPGKNAKGIAGTLRQLQSRFAKS